MIEKRSIPGHLLLHDETLEIPNPFNRLPPARVTLDRRKRNFALEA